LMQEATTADPKNAVLRDLLSGQSLLTLLALVGTKRMDVEALRERTKLTPLAFESLLEWLQREYLVDVITSLEGDQVGERVALTEKGEAALVSMLESTCELPELR
jgi:DNA-binding MarR family transcriptional regulator